MDTTCAPIDPARPADRSRDLYIDLLRAAALLVVVLWHWTFTTVSWSDAEVSVDNPLAAHGWLWALTWVAQPMCVFFAIGGHLHSTDRRPAGEFWAARLGRLVPPALPLLAAAALGWGAATAAGRADIADAVVLAISPLWFLAVYLILVAVAPAARVAHRHLGWGAVALLAAAVAALDAARLGGHISGWWVTVAMFVATWGCVHQLGFHLAALRQSRKTAVALSAAGFASLAALATFGPYPAAMVGNSADTMSNMGPPNLMVVALAAAQLGALAAASELLGRFAARHRDRLAVAGAWSMPVYVWHLSAFCMFYVAAHAAGVRNDGLDAAWWLQRPLWFLGPAVACAALLGVLSRSGLPGLPGLPRRADS